jgi:hypothetical protein
MRNNTFFIFSPPYIRIIRPGKRRGKEQDIKVIKDTCLPAGRSWGEDIKEIEVIKGLCLDPPGILDALRNNPLSLIL